MRVVLTVALVCLNSWSSANTGPGNKPPKFECTDLQGISYKIWIGKKYLGLHVQKVGEQARKIQLAVANAGRPYSQPGEPLLYNAWNLKERNFKKRLNMAHEFGVQYQVLKGTSRIRILSLVIDHKERKGLSCKVFGHGSTIVSSENESKATERYAKLLNAASTWRENRGTLNYSGIVGVEAAIRRMYHSDGFKDPLIKRGFIQQVRPGIQSLSARSVKLIEKRFPKKILAFWKKTLTDTGYKKSPQIERYITWVQQGVRPGTQRNLSSVEAGFVKFLNSPLYKNEQNRELFAAQTIAGISSLTREELKKVQKKIRKREGRQLMVYLWARGHLVSYPRVEKIVNDIGAQVFARPELFKPANLRESIMEFYSSAEANDPEARSLFIGATKLYINVLSPRQKEDVMGWFKKEERPLFKVLLR